MDLLLGKRHLKTVVVWSLAEESIHYCTTGSQSHLGHDCVDMIL